MAYRNGYRTRPARSTTFAEVRPGDLCEVVTVTGAAVRGVVVSVESAGVTVSHEVDVWPNGATTRETVFSWKSMRRRTLLSAGPAWESDIERGSRMSYGRNVNRRGRCIDAPCCGCCD